MLSHALWTSRGGERIVSIFQYYLKWLSEADQMCKMGDWVSLLPLITALEIDGQSESALSSSAAA